MKTTLLAGAAALLALAAAPSVHAQSIDYGSLQQLFNEPVTTSATGSPQRTTEVPVAMDIITAEDIKRSGATNLATILSRVPGLDILQSGAYAADLGVRGYNAAYSPRLLVLINGRQVYLDHYGYTAWASLPVQLDEIRQIEVVKGPNSALFGFNAVSGVINIITYNPKYDDVNVVTAHAGTQSSGEGSLVSTFRIGKVFSARASLGAAQQDEWKSSPRAFDPVVGQPAKLELNLDTITQLNDKTELRVEGSWSHSGVNELNPAYLYSNTKYLTHSIKAAIDSDTPFGAATVSAYQNFSKLDRGFFLSRVTVADAADLFKIGAANTFRVSAEYRNNEVNVVPFGPGEISYNVYAVSGMWNWAATSTVSFTAAGRFDALVLSRSGSASPLSSFTNADYNRTITEPSFNVGAVWRPTGQDTLRLTAARGIQLPSLAEFGAFALAEPTPFGVIKFFGNPNVNPTVIYNYEFDYDRALSQIGGKVSGRVFYQHSDQVQSANLAVLNVGTSDEKGVELAVSGAFGKGFRWSGNYAYTDVRNGGLNGVSVDANFADFAATTPRHRGNISLGWSDKRWSVDGFVRLVSDFREYTFMAPAPSPIAGYATFAARIARQFDHGVTVAVSGENLSQDRQRQTIGLYVPRMVRVSLSKSW